VSIIQKLKNEGSLILWHDYTQKNFSDYSGYGNSGVPTDVVWTGQGISFPESTSLITVADSPELQGEEFALLSVGDYQSQTNYQTLMAKYDAGGLNFQYYLGTSGVYLYDGVAARFASFNIVGSKFLGLNVKSGSVGQLFVDGDFASNLNGISTVTADDADLTIGAIYNNTNRLKSRLIHTCMVNRNLTASEWSELYGELSAPRRASTKVYSISNANITVDPSESGLVLGYNMRPEGGGLVDQSSSGNDGTIYGATYEQTPLGDALRFDGVDDYVLVPDSDSISLGASDYTLSMWINPDTVTGGLRLFSKELDANDKEYYVQILNGELWLGVKKDGVHESVITSAVLVPDLLQHIVISFNATTKAVAMYVDSELQSTTGSITTLPDIFTADLVLGRLSYAASSYYSGLMLLPEIYAGIKDQSWVTQEYNKGKRSLFKTEWGANESVSAVTSGFLENTPFQVVSGSFKISTDVLNANPSGVQLMRDGDMEEPTADAYTAGNNASLNKELSDLQGSNLCLRVDYNGTANPYAEQIFLKLGRSYRLRGDVRSDNIATIQIYNGSVQLANIAPTLNWQPVNITFLPTVYKQLRLYAITSAGYAEFDRFVIEELTPNVKVIECVTAGVCYIPIEYFQQTPTEAAFGNFKIWVKKADASNATVMFIAEVAGGYSATNQNGYGFLVDANERFYIVESTTGSVSNKMYTINGYVQPSTWIEIDSHRSPEGEFTTYIDNVLVDPTGGFGTNPFTDLTHTESALIALDLDAGDKVAFASKDGREALEKKLIV
jgi:hypothetical protein